MWRPLSCIFFIAFFHVGLVFGQHYQYKHFDQQAGLNQAYVYAFTQDHQGYLWVGTGNGLLKFNGFSFEQFSTDDSIADNYITAMLHQGETLWLGHQTGQITSISGNKIQKHNLPGAEEAVVVGFQAASNESMWIATYENGLFFLDKNRQIRALTMVGEVPNINCFTVDSAGWVILGTDKGLYLALFQSDNNLLIGQSVGGIEEGRVVTIQTLSSGDYMVATEDKGIFRLKIEEEKVWIHRIIPGKMLNDYLVSYARVDRQKNLWISAMGGGLAQVPGAFSMHEYKPELIWITGNKTEYIKTIFIDRDENLWLGHYGQGLTQFRTNPFDLKKIEYQGKVLSVRAMASDRGYYWLASGSLLFQYNKNGVLVKNPASFSSPISALCLGSSTELYIGTESSGLYKLNQENNQISKVNLGVGLLENSITDLEVLDNTLWIGTRKGLAGKYNFADETVWFTIQNGNLPHNVVNSIYNDNKGIWVATQSNTLVYFQAGVLHRKIEIPSENGRILINGITLDTLGNIWVGSNGQGIFRLSSDSVLNIREKDGLFSDYCYSLLTSDDGNILVSHRGGLSRVNPSNLFVSKVQSAVGLSGQEEIFPGSILKESNSEIWIGTSSGLIHYKPQLEQPSSQSPLLSMVSMRANGIELPQKEEIKIHYGNYKLRFEFIGIYLKEPEGVKYQYRLLGYDNEWSEVNSEGLAVFSNVSAGNYTFQLLASTSEGIVTPEPLEVKLTIRRAIWTLWYFYLLVFSILAFGAFLYIKRREFYLMQRNRLLEEKVQERTLEIERQGEIIMKKNLDITDSIKYARTIQSAIFPPEEILVEALHEYFLINKPKDIVSGDFCWYTRSKGKYVIALTDCTGHGVPGSIMSMLGITLLNEVVNNLGITDSAEILELLREKVISALNQHRRDNPSYDGMNVGLVVIDKQQLTLQYSGAFHNLYFFRGGVLHTIKAERTPVGFTPLEKPPFSAHIVPYQKGDMFYLFSDGYQDQFGGTEDKKFSNRRLLKHLSELQDKSIQYQKQNLEQTLTNWMQEREQTDDIILLGFRML